ncbi:MAG: SoxR reducing system RseC family protein [Bacteroidales bacterium]|jgi:positive regulator of sigma E activity|nr:SoxR reducing system RseC family protein [Bacteroidales bacterium]
MAEAIIEHIGYISKLSDHEIEATIKLSGACGGCDASSSCGMADNSSRVITISQSNKSVNLGDQVKVVGSQSTGVSAVFFAYMFPFIIVMLILILSLFLFNISELRAGLYSILILPPYYLVLYFLKEKFEKKYTFRIVS